MDRAGRGWQATVAVLIVAGLLYLSVLELLLRDNFGTDSAIYYWSSLRALLDAESFRLDNLGFDLLYGQLSLLWPFYYLPGLQSRAQYIVSIVVVSLLLAVWYASLRRSGFGFTQSVILVVLIAASPAMVWSATSGETMAMSLLFLYLLHSTILRILYDAEIRAYITAGLLMSLYVYFDATAVYILAVLLPLMMVFMPVKQLRQAPHSVYIIIGMPLLLMVFSWVYFNWIFHGDALAFLHSESSVYHGARREADAVDWLYAYGGEFLRPLSIGLLLQVAGYPVLIYLLYISHKSGRDIRANVSMACYPALTIALTTYNNYLASPLQITTLIGAIVMAEIVRLGSPERNTFNKIVLFLLMGMAVNWYLFQKETEPNIAEWRNALAGVQPEEAHGEVKLGRWLDQNRKLTLLDIRSGYKVVVARGDADGLVTSLTDEYQRALHSAIPEVTQIVVPNPDSDAGEHDEINRMFPEIYQTGLTGFRLVYDEEGWRVYQKI